MACLARQDLKAEEATQLVTASPECRYVGCCTENIPQKLERAMLTAIENPH